jgi:hypothetical protein
MTMFVNLHVGSLTTDITRSAIALKPTTVTTKATAAAVTFSSAELLGGLILRDPAGAARADKVPGAGALVDALGGNAVIGDSFEFTIRNTADAAETITLTTNTRMTMSGTMTIAQNNSKRFLVVATAVTAGAEAFTVYSLGTVVH